MCTDILETFYKKYNELSNTIDTGLIIDPNILDLSVSDYIYLNEIYRKGHITLGQLSQKLNVTKPSVTNMINKLMKADLIKKIQSKKDKRIYYVTLTKKGEDVMDYDRKKFIKIINIFLERLEENEKIELFVLLQKLINERG